MNLVKKSMGHGEINVDVYSKVWDECYSQVLFLPSKERFARANAASKKDRIESAEQKLEVRSEGLNGTFFSLPLICILAQSQFHGHRGETRREIGKEAENLTRWLSGELTAVHPSR